MTGQEAIAELNELVKLSAGDQEAAHSRGDEVLCELLTSIGYDDVVEVWNKINKWYA